MMEGSVSVTSWRRLRVVVYVFVAAAVLHAVVKAMAGVDPPDGEAYQALLGEDGRVEWAQAGLYAASGWALLIFGRGVIQKGVGCALLAMTVRELDRFLEGFVGSDVQGMLFRGLALLAVILVVRGMWLGPARAEPLAPLPRALLTIGALTALGFAQLLGQRDAWEHIIRPEYGSMGKRLAEESLELLGAVWVTLSAVEQLVFTRRARADS